MKTALAVVTVMLLPAFVEARAQQARIDRAKIDVKNLEKAVLAYKIKNGEFPESLAVLAQVQKDGSPAYLEKPLLRDPWDRPYQYEPNVVNQQTGYPLIYSQGPDPKDKKGYIRNWE